MSTAQPPSQAQTPVPDTAPPSYSEATASDTARPRISTEDPAERTTRNGIPPEHRRSMEDLHRPLPPGWVRQFDPIEQHQFFVDTRADPPRSTWSHPYDDEEYLATLDPEERKRHGRMHRSITLEDLEAESSDDEGHGGQHGERGTATAATGSAAQPKGLHKFGRKMKDALTSSTHQERETHRQQRAEQEHRAYIAHLQARQAMIRALETGQPQFLCKDRQGRDVYIEPPSGPAVPRGAFGYNPYAQGMYANPNARFLRPAGPYGRPYGRGYGGGLGAPVVAGFLGGSLLGGLLF